MKRIKKNKFLKKKEKINATLVSGVNGVGKTTTIGKISKILKANGNKVMLAASDTFRAAAIEQLESWANKVDIEFSTGKLSITIDENNSIHMKGAVSDIKNIEIKI